jgi:hypothetical protein
MRIILIIAIMANVPRSAVISPRPPFATVNDAPPHTTPAPGLLAKNPYNTVIIKEFTLTYILDEIISQLCKANDYHCHSLIKGDGYSGRFFYNKHNI